MAWLASDASISSEPSDCFVHSSASDPGLQDDAAATSPRAPAHLTLPPRFSTPFLDHPSVFSYICAFFFTPSFFLCSPLLSSPLSSDVRPSIRFCNRQCTCLDSNSKVVLVQWLVNVFVFVFVNALGFVFIKANECESLRRQFVSSWLCLCRGTWLACKTDCSKTRKKWAA